MAKDIKYPVFQNKSLDYNKLLESQAEGKLLKKILKFPLIAMVKYDGHYVVIDVKGSNVTFTSSGGVRYSHSEYASKLNLPDGTYIAERIVGDGKLGDSRRGVALEGSVGSKYAKANNNYIMHNIVINKPYEDTLKDINHYIPKHNRPTYKIIPNKVQLDEYMKYITREGYEGLMLIQPDYIFKNTKSRNIGFCKYKKRPTADLLCVGTTDGEGKYVGMIGSLILKDSQNRIVNVGSGLDDSDRCVEPEHFIGKVIEIEYEQIANTYIQPTFITIRLDKLIGDID